MERAWTADGVKVSLGGEHAEIYTRRCVEGGRRTMRDIIEAKIASLEELAGQLKGLSNLKQGVADDQEYPPHNAEALQKKRVNTNVMPLLL